MYIIASMRKISAYWPELIVSIVLLAIVLGMALIAASHNGGKFIYDLDDSYIHMALAKNLVKYHVWGVYGNEFTSVSSSLLWTITIYLNYLVFGINELSPFILNLLFALGTIFLSGFILSRFKISGSAKLIILAAIVFIAPMPALPFSGLEHMAHLMLTIAYIFMAGKALSYSSSGINHTWDDYRKYRYAMYVLAPVLVMARYEGLFLLGMVSLLLLFRKKILAAVINAILGVLPISVFGFYAVYRGWYFLPNSVMMKGNMPDFGSALHLLRYPATFIVHLINYPHLLIILAVILGILYLRLNRTHSLWDEFNMLLLLFAGMTLLHAQFASSGWLYRYESYLMGTGILIIGVVITGGGLKLSELSSLRRGYFPQIVLVLTIFIIAAPALKRGYNSITDVVQVTSDIYGEQYQTARFLNKYYADEPVAVNDLGVVNFYSNIKCVDLLGLGNREIGEARVKFTYNSDFIERICRENDVSLAVLNEEIFRLANIGGVPKSWIAVARWKMAGGTVYDDDHWTFYAIDKAKARQLVQNLKDFSSCLPSGVKQTWLYIESEDTKVLPAVSNK